MRRLNFLNGFFIFLILFLGIRSNLWAESITKAQLFDFAKSKYDQINEDKTLAPETRLYLLSMPLLTLAKTDAYATDYPVYRAVFKKMRDILDDTTLSTPIPQSLRLWMMGRMAFSLQLTPTHRDHELVEQLKFELEQGLLINNPKTVQEHIFTGWAIAYLAAIDSNVYNTYAQYKLQLFESAAYARMQYAQTPSQANASNLVWTLTMNLYAAALVHNQTDYEANLQALLSVASPYQLKTTVALVPETDYRLWLISLLRESFWVMNDQKNLQALPRPEIGKLTDLQTMMAATFAFANLTLHDESQAL